DRCGTLKYQQEDLMVNPRRNDMTDARDIVPIPGESPRPAILEGYGSDYYYGRTTSKSALARSYIQIFIRQRYVLFTAFFAVMAIGLLVLLTRPTMYRSTAEMLVTPIGNINQDTENLAQNIGTMTRVRSVATELRLLNSPDLLDEAFAALPMGARKKGYGTTQRSLPRYPITIANPRDTDVITVEVMAKDPDAAAQLANQVLETNISRTQETTKHIAELATNHVDTELADCDVDLRKSLAELAAVKRSKAIVDVNTQASADSQALSNLESQVAQARSEAVRAQVARKLLERELRRTSTNVVSSVTKSDNPVLKTVDDQIEALQQQRAALLQEYLPNSTEVRNIDQQILEAKKRKKEALTNQSQSVTEGRNPIIDKLQEDYINSIVAEQESASRAAITEAQAKQVRGRLSTLPAVEEKVALLTSHISELQTTHAYLTSQKQALTLSMHGGLPSAMPITYARPNRIPASPNIPASLLLLIVVAAITALGGAILRDQLDDHVHTVESLEGLTGRRVLASLPKVRNGMRGLVTDEECPPALLESFRLLRGNILFSSLNPLPRLIMVTSAKAGEGKSTTVANLAATIAMNGKRVLIIDCDMRHPSMHAIYDKDNSSGLSAVLLGQLNTQKAIQSTGIENIDLLPAGIAPANTPELLALPRMQTLLDEVSTRYDCVLFDSTPMLNLSDGTVLASLVEGVLVVVSSDQARSDDLQQALRSLEMIGTPILGLVYNRSADSPALEWQA
ncbi:MAG TPA: polysaccharide biosynthesis tyrosine autokinase, partial [Armatimonadota bacterium]|nr:polysaccharide biosynthesis tyrosine autokinase [Armatimonadota bacterium]